MKAADNGGVVADTAGWRTIFLVAAAVAVLFAVLLYRAIPPLKPKTRMAYPALLASVASVVRNERVVRWTLVLAATRYAAFTMFWTSLTFLLSSSPFFYPVWLIGLFGLAGLAGAIAAQRVGRLHDRGWSLPATGVAWAVILGAFVLAAFAGQSVVLLVIVVIVLDVGLQAVAILNQLRVFAVSDEARSRINTAYVTSSFLGGAIGSAAAAVLWSSGGWTAVAVAGAVLSCIAIAVWAIGRQGALAAA